MTDTFAKWWEEYAEKQRRMTALGAILGCRPIPPGLEGCGCEECNDYSGDAGKTAEESGDA